VEPAPPASPPSTSTTEGASARATVTVPLLWVVAVTLTSCESWLTSLLRLSTRSLADSPEADWIATICWFSDAMFLESWLICPAMELASVAICPCTCCTRVYAPLSAVVKVEASCTTSCRAVESLGEVARFCRAPKKLERAFWIAPLLVVEVVPELEAEVEENSSPRAVCTVEVRLAWLSA
jgi:hypothetical protein